MNYKESFLKSLDSIWIILKLIIPIYILADILYYYNTLSYISFLIEPFTALLGLPPQTSLSIISGMFLNVYAAVAFAAPLELSIHQWSVLAVFVGICHALPVEGMIMKKIGISNIYSYSLRITSGFLIAYLTYLLPSDWFSATLAHSVFQRESHDTLLSLLQGSLTSAAILSLKVIVLITILIFIMDFIKSRRIIIESQKNVSKGFSISVGMILGITYGAGILIKEVQSGNIKDEDIFYIATFLMISHAIIEDTLLFVIFGADFTMVVAIRTIAAIIFSWIFLKIYQYKRTQYANI
jgi:hypothetical protein